MTYSFNAQRFADAVKAARGKETHKTFAQRIGVPERTVYRAEAAELGAGGKFLALCSVLRLSPLPFLCDCSIIAETKTTLVISFEGIQ